MRKNARIALDRWEQGIESIRSDRGGSIWTDGANIWSYQTALVTVSKSGQVYLNVTKYSITTTIHQNALRAHFPEALQIDGIPQGHASLRALWDRGVAVEVELIESNHQEV